MACYLSDENALSPKISSKNRVVKAYFDRTVNVKQKEARVNGQQTVALESLENEAFYLCLF